MDVYWTSVDLYIIMYVGVILLQYNYDMVFTFPIESILARELHGSLCYTNATVCATLSQKCLCNATPYSTLTAKLNVRR